MKRNFKPILIISLLVASLCAVMIYHEEKKDEPMERREKHREIAHRLADLSGHGSNQFLSMVAPICEDLTKKEMERLGKGFEDGRLYSNELGQDLFYKVLYLNPQSLSYFEDRPYRSK